MVARSGCPSLAAACGAPGPDPGGRSGDVVERSHEPAGGQPSERGPCARAEDGEGAEDDGERRKGRGQLPRHGHLVELRIDCGQRDADDDRRRALGPGPDVGDSALLDTGHHRPGNGLWPLGQGGAVPPAAEPDDELRVGRGVDRAEHLGNVHSLGEEAVGDVGGIGERLTQSRLLTLLDEVVPSGQVGADREQRRDEKGSEGEERCDGAPQAQPLPRPSHVMSSR